MSILLCVMVGCTQSDPSCDSSLQGSVTVRLNATSTTRATTPGNGDIYRGGGMEDLTLILVNSMGYISDIQRLSSLTGAEQLVKSVTFVNLDVGNYMLYAYANVERSLLDEVKAMLASLKVGDEFGSSLYNALFSTLSGRETPIIDDSHPLLLTASKPLTVEVENSYTTIDMLRPVVWFEVRLFNHSDYQMTVSDISFSNFNPSTGYVLPKDGNISSSVNYRGLPLYDTYTGGTDLVVPATTESCVYETALFENRAPSYTMSLSLMVESSSLETATSLSTSGTYALKNRSTGKYLVDNGSGTMAVVSSIAEALSSNHAMWKFSGTSSGYMTNVATGKRYYRSVTSSSSGSNLTFAKSNSYYRISYYNRSTYYLRDNNGSVTFSTGSANSRDWILQQMQSVQQTASISNSQINVVDMATAAVTPMTEQLRNQHIKIVINAYYNEIAGQFNFVVQPWIEKNEEVEFN